MAKHRTDLLYGHAIPQDFLDALQEFISTYVSPNFSVTVVNTTTLRVPAGSVNGQVGIGLNGKWRYNVANADAALPGGLADGDHPIFCTASDNVFSGGSGGTNEVDTTDYTFRLIILQAGQTPTGTGTQALWRQVGNVSVVSGLITDVRLLVGGGGALPRHASQHLGGAADAISWASVHGVGLLAARPAAAAANSGYLYLATDVAGGTSYRSNGAAWVQEAAGVTQAAQFHASTHLAGGTDAISWATVNGYGTLGARPAAGTTNFGYLYYATDAGSLYRSDGATWAALSQSAAALAQSIHLYGTLAARPAPTGANVGFLYTASDVNGGTVYENVSGGAWVQIAHGLNIAAGEVTDAMLAGAIAPAKVAGTAVITSDARLSDQRVPTANSVDSSKVADGALTPAKTAGTAVITSDARLSDQRVPTPSSVDDTKVAVGALSANRISGIAVINSDARLSDQRVPTDGSVTVAKMAAQAVTLSKLSALFPDPTLALGLLMIEGVLPYNGMVSGVPQTSLAPSVGAGWALAIGAGRALIQGDDSAAQGMYLYALPGGGSITLVNTSVANPRLDMIAVQVNDVENGFTGRSPAGASIIQVQGTQTAGATLANRSGAPSLPVSAIWLCDYLIQPGDGSVNGARIGDKRILAGPGLWGEDNHRYRLGVDSVGALILHQVV